MAVKNDSTAHCLKCIEISEGPTIKAGGCRCGRSAWEQLYMIDLIWYTSQEGEQLIERNTKLVLILVFTTAL